jgi:hypothetical protein
MFENSVIESSGRLKTKRGRTTTFSFFLGAIIVGIMVLIPLLFTEALPKAQLMMALIAPPPPPPPAVVRVVKPVQTDIVNHPLRTPSKIPKEVKIINEEVAPPPVSSVVGGVPAGATKGEKPCMRRQGYFRSKLLTVALRPKLQLAFRNPSQTDQAGSKHPKRAGLRNEYDVRGALDVDTSYVDATNGQVIECHSATCTVDRDSVHACATAGYNVRQDVSVIRFGGAVEMVG